MYAIRSYYELRGRLMPPPGNPQPDQNEVDGLVSWLEESIDAGGVITSYSIHYTKLYENAIVQRLKEICSDEQLLIDRHRRRHHGYTLL